MITLTPLGFTYLGQQYRCPHEIVKACVKTPRRLFSQAIPLHDQSKSNYYFWIMTNPYTLETIVTYSSNKNHYKRYRDAARNKTFKNLTKQECLYLSKIYDPDIHKHISLVEDAIKTDIENP